MALIPIEYVTVYTRNMEKNDDRRPFLERITRDAGNIIKPLFGKTGVKYDKGHALNVVTEADIKVNEFLIREIRKQHPDHGFTS